MEDTTNSVSRRWSFYLSKIELIDVTKLNELNCEYIVYHCSSISMEGFIIFHTSRRITSCRSLIPTAFWTVLKGRSESKRDELKAISYQGSVVERGKLPTFANRAMAGGLANKRRLEALVHFEESNKTRSHGAMIHYLNQVDCLSAAFLRTYTWLIKDSLSVDSNIWRPFSSGRLWPRTVFFINPIFMAINAIEIITNTQNKYRTSFGPETTPPPDSAAWTSMMMDLIVQPACQKLKDLQITQLVPFSIEALHYKNSELPTGFHNDPKAYKAIACLTLLGRGSLSIGAHEQALEVSKMMGPGEGYLIVGDAAEKYQHKVDLDFTADRVVLVLRFVDKAIMDEIHEMRDESVMNYKTGRYPKRYRKA